MKSKVLISAIIIVATLSIFNITVHAQNKSLVYTNIIETEAGSVKEYISVNSMNKKPVSKKIYKRNKEGYITEVVIYVWNNRYEWQYKTKFEYVYSESNKILSIISTNWDAANNKWANSAKYMTYNYSENGDIGIKIYNIDKSKDIFLTELAN